MGKLIIHHPKDEESEGGPGVRSLWSDHDKMSLVRFDWWLESETLKLENSAKWEEGDVAAQL